jgi:hypothetical protein
MRIQKFLPTLVGILCILMTSLPFFHTGFFRPHDFTHAARIVEMNRSLQSFEFPVRWSQNFGFGYGMPLFNFYAPLPYYVAQIPYVLTQNAIFSIKILYFLNSVLAFIGMYLLAKELWGKTGGLISGAAFTFSTYRAVDLFVRGAIGEATAMVLIPFVLYGVHRIRTHRTAGLLYTAIALAAVLLSHNLIGMITVGLVLVYGWLSLGRKQILWVCSAVVLALLLSAFYILPAYVEKDFTRVEESITTGYFDFHNHFVALRQFVTSTWGYGGSQPGLEDGMSFALGAISLVLAVIALMGLFLTDKKRKLGCVLLFFLAGSMFMASNKSVFIWEHIQQLKYLQFPWRFLTFVHIFLSLLTGASILALQKLTGHKTVLLSMSIVTVVLLATQARFFAPETYITHTAQFYDTDPFFIRTQMSRTLNDYLPKQIQNDAFPEATEERLTVLSGDGWVSVNQDHPTKLRSTISCQTDCVIQINTFQFPGWQLILNGKPTSLEPALDFPVYILTLPSGEHDITVQLTDTPVRKLGNILSVIGIVVIFVLYGKYFSQRSDRQTRK